MSEVEKPTKQIPLNKTLPRRLRDWLLGLSSALLVFGLGLFSLFWTYQTHTYVYRLDLTTSQASSDLSGFYPPQLDQPFQAAFRWSSPLGYVSLTYPSAPFEITFHAAANRPDGRPVELQVIINGKDVRLFALDSQPHEYILRSRLVSLGPQNLYITFRPLTTFVANGPDGPREQGIALDWIEVRQAASRFGPVIPPPFVLGWWLLVALLPLGMVRLLAWPFKIGLSLGAATFALLDLLYLLPEPAQALREQWAIVGLLIVLLQVCGLAGLVVRLRLARSSHLKPLYWSGWLWLLVGLGLFYLATGSGRLTSPQELQSLALTYNLTHLQPAAPIDVLLPDPPPGLVNPSHAATGLGYTLLASPLYWLGWRFSRALPYLPANRVDDNGLIVYVTLWLNLLLALATVGGLGWFLRRLGYRRRTALICASLLGVTTTLWPEARRFDSQALDGLLLLGLVAAAWLYNYHPARRWPLLCGLTLGLLVLEEGANIYLALPLLVYFYLAQRRSILRRVPPPAEKALPAAPDLPRLPAPAGLVLLPVASEVTFRPGTHKIPGWPFLNWLKPSYWRNLGRPHLVKRDNSWLLGLGIPFVIAAIGRGWYNLAGWGSPLSESPANPSNANLWDKLYLWLVSPEQGFLWHNPLLLLALGGTIAWQKSQPVFLKLAGGLSLLYFVSRWVWTGWDGRPGWQMLAPLLPLGFVILAPLIEMALAPITEPGSAIKLVEATRWERYLLRVAIIVMAVWGLLAELSLVMANAPALAPQFYRDSPLGAFVTVLQTGSALLLLSWTLLAWLWRLEFRTTGEPTTLRRRWRRPVLRKSQG